MYGRTPITTVKYFFSIINQAFNAKNKKTFQYKYR